MIQFYHKLIKEDSYTVDQEVLGITTWSPHRAINDILGEKINYQSLQNLIAFPVALHIKDILDLWQPFKKNHHLVQVRCTILDAWGWCTGTTQRDGMGREEGGGFRMGNTCIPVADSF